MTKLLMNTAKNFFFVSGKQWLSKGSRIWQNICNLFFSLETVQKTKQFAQTLVNAGFIGICRFLIMKWPLLEFLFYFFVVVDRGFSKSNLSQFPLWKRCNTLNAPLRKNNRKKLHLSFLNHINSNYKN